MTKGAVTAATFNPDTLPYSNIISLLHLNLPNVGYPVTKTHVAGLFWAVVLGWTSLGVVGSGLVADVLAVVYPACQSYRCERDNTSPSQWLAYWTVYSLFFIVESGNVLTQLLPFYYSIKLVIMMWCMYPGAGNGAAVIYSALRPLLALLDSLMSGNHGNARLRKISFNEAPPRRVSKEEMKHMKDEKHAKPTKDDHGKHKDGKNSPKDKHK